MARDKVRLAMTPSGGRTLVQVMESGAVKLAEDMTPEESKQAADILSAHLRERAAEEDRLRRIVKQNGLIMHAGQVEDDDG